MKKVIFSLVIAGVSLFSFSFAQNLRAIDGGWPHTKEENFTLIPADHQGKGEKAIKEIINWEGSFTQKYKQTASGLSMEAQLNSGIVNFEGIKKFLIHLVKILLDAGMVIGFLMIVYSGYIYASGVFTGNVTKGNNAIKNAVIGLLIVIFSYTIIRIITSMFL